MTYMTKLYVYFSSIMTSGIVWSPGGSNSMTALFLHIMSEEKLRPPGHENHNHNGSRLILYLRVSK